jgi:hypothetical protein
VEKGDELFFRVIGLEAPVFSLKKDHALFPWLINHQRAVLFSQNKPASSTFLSEQISTSHQPSATSKTNRLQTEITAHVFITAIS